jgi:hypothetical protein
MKIAVFLSYAHTDREVAATIVDLLRSLRIDCWFDQKGIPLGSRFDREIEQAIRRSSAVVWLVSSNSVVSDFVKFELTTAWHHRKPILPIRLEPIDLAHLPAPLNLKLGNVQAWDYFVTSADNLGADLAAGLRGLVLRDRPPRVTPPRLAGLPFGEVMKIAYNESPPAPVSGKVRTGLHVEIQARRRGQREFTFLRDGEALTSRSDDYRIIVKVLSPGYLYLFQVDAMGKVDWLFPRNATSPVSGGSNPLAAGQSICVPTPDSGTSMYLDTTVGIEHVYAVYSATQWPRLEGALGRSPPVEEQAASVAVATRGLIDEPNELGLRGVGGVRKDAAAGAGADSPPVGDRFQGESYFVVLERWFRHVAPQ